MNEQGPAYVGGILGNESAYHLLSEIDRSPYLTQRDLSIRLNISLGKTNYLIRALVKKGAVKASNFTQNPGKLRKVQYVLTGDGFQEKMRLTYYFLRKKEAEYVRLREEWDRLNVKLPEQPGNSVPF
jgi:EPS-associated MarR family transcriptional regulator